MNSARVGSFPNCAPVRRPFVPPCPEATPGHVPDAIPRNEDPMNAGLLDEQPTVESRANGNANRRPQPQESSGVGNNANRSTPGMPAPVAPPAMRGMPTLGQGNAVPAKFGTNNNRNWNRRSDLP